MFASGLRYPFGIAFYPPGADPQWVYVADTGAVLRFPYRSGDLAPRGEPETVVPQLPVGGHATRDVAFSPDGATIYVSIGSRSNDAEDMGRLAGASRQNRRVQARTESGAARAIEVKISRSLPIACDDRNAQGAASLRNIRAASHCMPFIER